MYASAEKPGSLALAVSDSAQANAHMLLRDLRGFNTVAGEVEVKAYLGLALIDEAKADASSVYLALAFDEADFDNDGDVDFSDFFVFADKWPSDIDRTYHVRIDLDGSGKIDFNDFFVFADHFNRRRDGGLAKPAVIPEDPPSETIGHFSPEETAQAWQALKSASHRAAKVAQSTPTYRLVVRSMEQKFAPLDTLVTGNFIQLQNIEVRVNTPPTAVIAPGRKDTMVFGDTLRVVMSRFFATDDALRFRVENQPSPELVPLQWEVRDSTLIITTAAVGRDVITFRATDSANQSASYELLVEALAPADREAPILLMNQNISGDINIQATDNSGQVRVKLIRNDTSLVFTGTFVSPFDTILAVSRFGLGTHRFAATAQDAREGGTAASLTVTVAPKVQIKVRTDAPASVETLTVENNFDRLKIKVGLEVNGQIKDSLEIISSLSNWPVERYLAGGDNRVRILANVAGRDTVLADTIISRGDRTPVSMELTGIEWNGVEKTELNFIATFFDSISGVAGFGISGYAGTTLVLDNSGNAGGRQKYEFSLQVNYPRVSTTTRREIKMRARDVADNFREASFFVDQPVSPEPPPPVVVTPPPPPPPPPALTGPGFSSASLNGNAPGSSFSISAGETLSLSFSGITGNPSPSATLLVNTGSGFSNTGGATYTPNPGAYNIKGQLTNSQGSVETATWSVTVQGGAPKRIVPTTPH